MPAFITANNSYSNVCEPLGFYGARISSRGPSLSGLVKAALVLALLLRGGVDARRSSSRGWANNGGGSPPPPPKAFKYPSICDTPADLPPITHNECWAQENDYLKELHADKSRDRSKFNSCFIASGVISGAFFGLSFLSYLATPESEENFGSVLSGAGGVFAVIPFGFCGSKLTELKRNLQATERKAKECCDKFPTQDQQAASQANAGNTTLAVTPPSANSSMPINSTTSSARRY